MAPKTLYAIHIDNGKEAGFIAGTADRVEITRDKTEALYWRREDAETIANHTRAGLNCKVTLVSQRGEAPPTITIRKNDVTNHKRAFVAEWEDAKARYHAWINGHGELETIAYRKPKGTRRRFDRRNMNAAAYRHIAEEIRDRIANGEIRNGILEAKIHRNVAEGIERQRMRTNRSKARLVASREAEK